MVEVVNCFQAHACRRKPDDPYSCQSDLQFTATSWQNQQNDCVPSEDSDQPVCLKKAWALNYLLSAQQRLWSDWADAEADPSLRWAHIILLVFVIRGSFITIKWAPSSEFVSSSIPSWQILTAHVQPFRRARDLAFCLKVPLDSLLVWASCGGSGETARMRRLAWTFAARIGDKYQIRLTPSKWSTYSI